MRSIRLSLLSYFLILLALALGTTSLLAYRSAQQTLQAKEEATARLIHNQYDTRIRAEVDRVDEALLSRAKSLARRFKFKENPHRRTLPRIFMGVSQIGAPPPLGGMANRWLMAHLAENYNSPVHYYFFHRYHADITLPVEDVDLPSEGEAPDERKYHQISSNHWGVPLRSKTLGDQSLPDADGFAMNEQQPPPSWLWDDLELSGEHTVRRLRLKLGPSAQWVRSAPGSWGPRPRNGGKGPPPPPTPTPPPVTRMRWFDLPPPTIIVQCAADTVERDRVLAGLREDRDRELAALREMTAQSLAMQRYTFFAIIGGALFLTIVGACWLVGEGLRPLRRLSEAVSQISPRDFRLPLDDMKMPVELRPITDRLTVTLDLLKRAFAREKQATADISHELRTPLAAMLTTLELGLRKPRTPEKYRELLADCHDSARHMNQIVERLLALARIDSGVDLVRPTSVDVSELARQCAAVVRPLAESHGLTLSHHESDALVAMGSLYLDPDKLREVLTNLLHNAVQYNRPNGTIELFVDHIDNRVIFEVRDSGIGVSPELRERIFERFFRGDPSRTSDGMNAGLGLAIVKEYVGLMGGEISVHGAEGQGSTFRVELPARPAPRTVPAESVSRIVVRSGA